MSAGADTKVAQITGIEAINMALMEAMEADPTVADPEGGGVLKCTQGLSTRFGDHRVRSTPISEQAIMGAAVGAAIAGMRPVAEIMLMNFISVAMDQLVNHAAKIRYMSGGATSVPLTVRTLSGAGMSLGGQHSDMLEAWLAHTPGLKVVIPSNPADYKGLLLSCIEDDNPCVFIENSTLMYTPGDAPPPGHKVPLGKAATPRVGSDVTLVAYGRPVLDCIAVADKLAAEGISVEVVALRTIGPMDEAAICASVGKTGREVIVHEAVKRFGVGAEIAARINEECYGKLKAPVGRIGAKYSPVPFSSALEKDYIWTAAGIEAAVRKVMG